MSFFSRYPKTVYKSDELSSLDLVTNLTVNFSFLGDLLDNSAVYYEYTVAEGDTPEIVAYKVYGYADYHWIIMKINGIVDIKTQWPLEYKTLNDTIDIFYSSSQYANNSNTGAGLSWAKSNIKSYYKIETRTVVDSLIVETIKISVDQNTYNTIVVSSEPTIYTANNGEMLSVSINKDTETYYDYEINANENKRQIKILKSEFVAPLIDEFTRVMANE
jgi:hypothetical protein